MSDSSMNEAEIAPSNGVIAATAPENDAIDLELTKGNGGAEIDEPDTVMHQNGHLMKETVTIESGENAPSSTITVTVENESTNAIDEPANIEVEVKIKQLSTENGSSEMVQGVSSAESAEITVIEEHPSQTNIEIEETSGDNQNNEVKLTEEDQEKLQDIYEDLFKGAQEEEEKERQEEQQEDEEGGKRRRQCHCDCDTLLRGIQCNKKVIMSKFCICGRRRRRQRASAVATQQAQSANISATNPAIVVEQQVSIKPAPEEQESATEDEEPKTEEPIAKALEVEEFMTPTMQRARKQGWSFYGKFAFPLVSDIVRDFWVIGELCLLVLSFLVSLVFFALDENNRKGFNIFHLILTIIASIFALIDAILQLKECTSCKAAVDYHKKVKKSKEADYDVDHTEDNDGKKAKHESDSEASSQNDEGTDNNNIESDGSTTKCQARIEKFKDRMDIVRTLVSEAIFYPLLICDLFEFITGRGYEVSNASDHLSLVLFLLSCLGIFLYVYLARIMVLCSVVVNVHKKRQTMRKNKEDPTGLYVQVYFAAHVFLQMIAQIFMIVAIAAKISYENRFYNPDHPACEGESPSDMFCSTHASSRLWYMLIAAYIMPLCGILTFYIVCYYWITELPLTVCLDFLRILEAGSCDSFLSPIKSNKEKIHKSKGILKHYHDSLWRDFEKIYEVSFMQKLLFPFRNPLVIVLCLVYAAFQLAFVVCAGFSGAAASDTFRSEQITVILNDGTGWAVFFFIAAIMGALANAYVFIIAYFWLFFIIIVVLLLLLYVLCVLCELCTIVDDCMECRRAPTPNRLRRAFGV